MSFSNLVSYILFLNEFLIYESISILFYFQIPAMFVKFGHIIKVGIPHRDVNFIKKISCERHLYRALSLDNIIKRLLDTNSVRFKSGC